MGVPGDVQADDQILIDTDDIVHFAVKASDRSNCNDNTDSNYNNTDATENKDVNSHNDNNGDNNNGEKYAREISDNNGVHNDGNDNGGSKDVTSPIDEAMSDRLARVLKPQPSYHRRGEDVVVVSEAQPKSFKGARVAIQEGRDVQVCDH